MLEVRSLIPACGEEKVLVSERVPFPISVICIDDTKKCAILCIGMLTGCPLCRESHPSAGYGNLDIWLYTCRLSSCNPKEYIPVDNVHEASGCI